MESKKIIKMVLIFGAIMLALMVIIGLISTIIINKARTKTTASATEIHKFLKVIMPGGIACESYLDGEFFQRISLVTVNLDKKSIEKIVFDFRETSKSFPYAGTVYASSYRIDEIDIIDAKKIVMKGENEVGWDFISSISLLDNYLVDFNIAYNGGRGRTEIRQIGENGLKLKDKYLKDIYIGHINE